MDPLELPRDKDDVLKPLSLPGYNKEQQLGQHGEWVLIAVLPCMKEPTLARLHGEDGYAVKAAVRRELLAALIPELKARGGSDIVVYPLSQIVP
jgi:ATP phosphoribosyltransferase